MGPLFTALVVLTGAALVLAIAFVAARFFQPTSVAIRIALVFVAGTAFGGGITVVGLSFFVSETLVAPWQVIAYFTSLATGAIFGGASMLAVSIRYRVLTMRSSEPQHAASA
jgi:hypothetical protein